MAKVITTFLVLAGGLLAGATIGSAQEFGLGGTYGSSARSSLIGGPGLEAWSSLDLFSAVRLQASIAGEWGRETERRSFCSFTSPEGGGPDDCVVEDVRSFTTIATADFSAILLSPRLLGTRLGLGANYGIRHFDVGQEGLETGRIQVPAEGRRRTLDGAGWVLLVEHSVPGMPVSLRASYYGYRVDFGECIMDTWSLCGDERFGRFTVGLGYRVF
jgi:hypothetical protein